MKFIFYILLFTFYSSTAQVISLGVKVGAVASGYPDPSFDVYVSNDQRDKRIFKPNLGFEAGITSKIKFKEWFYLSPEIKFITKGASYDSQETNDLNTFKVSSQYLSLPLLLVFKPIKWLNIEVGPEIGYLTGYSFTYLNYYRNYTYEQETNQNKVKNIDGSTAISPQEPMSPYYVKPYLDSRVEISAILGISFNPSKNMTIGVQYSYAFNNNLSIMLIDQNFSQLGDVGIYNRYLSFSLRYYFFNFK